MSDTNVVKCEQCEENVSIGYLFSQGMKIDIAEGFKERPLDDYNQTMEVWLQCDCSDHEWMGEITEESAKKLKQLVENQKELYWDHEFREMLDTAIAYAVPQW